MPGGSWKVIIPPFCVKEKTLSYRLGCWPLTITEIKVFLWSFSGEKPEQIRGETWVFTIDVLGSLGGERVMWPRKHHSFLFNQASSLRTHYYLQPRPGKTTRSTGTIRLMGGGGVTVWTHILCCSEQHTYTKYVFQRHSSTLTERSEWGGGQNPDFHPETSDPLPCETEPVMFSEIP